MVLVLVNFNKKLTHTCTALSFSILQYISVIHNFNNITEKAAMVEEKCQHMSVSTDIWGFIRESCTKSDAMIKKLRVSSKWNPEWTYSKNTAKNEFLVFLYKYLNIK